MPSSCEPPCEHHSVQRPAAEIDASRRLASGAALREGAGGHRTSLNCTMWGCIKDLWFMISRSTYLVTCRHQAGSEKGRYMTGLLVQLHVQQRLPGRLSKGSTLSDPRPG